MTAPVRRHLALAFATAAVITVLGWLAVSAGRRPALSPAPAPVATADLDGALPPAPVGETIARARTEVRARLPARSIIAPPNAPAPGLPAWTTYLPGQRDPGMPTPRGTR